MCAGVRPCKTRKPYQRGEFDFVAAYVIPEDVWYIIPARVVVHGKRTGIPLYTSSPTGKYEAYKELGKTRVAGAAHRAAGENLRPSGAWTGTLESSRM
jgi:hypothetical protein